MKRKLYLLAIVSALVFALVCLSGCDAWEEVFGEGEEDGKLTVSVEGVTMSMCDGDGVTDNDSIILAAFVFDAGSDIELLQKAGINIRMDCSAQHMHHKFAVIDDERLLTGSYNWTRSAADYNYENLMVTNDVGLVKPFAEEFDRLWAMWG